MAPGALPVVRPAGRRGGRSALGADVHRAGDG